MEKSKTVCFSGYRPSKMPHAGDEKNGEIQAIKKQLQQAILDAIDAGYTHFICGMADGWDTWAYDAQLSYADKITVLSERYHSGVFHVRNRYMVDNAGLLICYYDEESGGTQYTVRYAEKQGIKIINIAE